MWTSRYIVLLITTLAFSAGCFGEFNPDERQYPCKSKVDCIAGYACALAVEGDSASESVNVCARQCDDDSVLCPNGFRCSKGKSAPDRAEILVCVSNDASLEVDQGVDDLGVDPDFSLDTEDAFSGSTGDVGFQFDMGSNCETGGCGANDLVDGSVSVGAVECQDACEGYCVFLQNQCQVPCSVSQCLDTCDSSEGESLSQIIRLSMGSPMDCSFALGDVALNMEDPLLRYEDLGVSCPEFCEDLNDFLSDTTDGAGSVCGAFVECDQADCISACESDRLGFSQHLGEITLSVTHEVCPLSAPLVDEIGDSNQSLYVKNLCIPCEATCEVLFPNDASSGTDNEFWCGVVQRATPCPTLSSRAVCNQQCTRHPEQFFVKQASEICGDPGDSTATSVIAARTPLCGAQCESTNTAWGASGSFTMSPVTFTDDSDGTPQLQVVTQGTRICFRAQGIDPVNDPRCDLVILVDQQRFAQFEINFDPNRQDGSVSDPSQNTLKYAAKFTAHAEGTASNDLFAMAIYHNFSGMLLRESIPDPIGSPDNEVYDVVTPVLNDGDISMISRRITGEPYRMEFLFNDVQTPSALTIDHFTIGSTGDIDDSCQNQCFERSGGDFCRDLCDPDEGLMALCAQTVNMPRRSGVPFTSDLSASDEPQIEYCAAGDTLSGAFAKPFDADSCMRECKRNRCDLQFQINALWHPGTASEGGICHRLNFGGYQGWKLDENLPDESGESVASTQLCCLCSHDYCEGILRSSATPIDCGD